MSSGEKYPHADMLEMAGAIMANVAPAWGGIKVAGSLRRGVAQAGDIEFVVHARNAELNATLDRWLQEGAIKKRVNKKGNPIAWGDLNRAFVTWDKLRGGRSISVDWFNCNPASFGLYFIVRTGPADFSRAMVTSRSKGGLMPDNFKVKNWRVFDLETGEALNTRYELDVFRSYGLPYMPPYDRNVRIAKKWLQYDLHEAVGLMLINKPLPAFWPDDMAEIINRARYYGMYTGLYPRGIKWPQIDIANEGVYKPDPAGGRPHGGGYVTPYNVMLFAARKRGLPRDFSKRSYE